MSTDQSAGQANAVMGLHGGSKSAQADDRAKFETLTDDLRRVAGQLRTKPTPLADVIPLLQRAADALASAQAASAEPAAPCAASCLAAGGGTQDDYCNLTQGECARKLTTPAPAVAPAAVTDEQINKLLMQQDFWSLAGGDIGWSFGPQLRDFARAVLALATRTPEPQAERSDWEADRAAIGLHAASGDEDDLREACNMIEKVRKADTNGDALFAVVSYRKAIREKLLAEPQPDSRGQAREGWKPPREFTTGDDDLNTLLDLTACFNEEGRWNHDTGMQWLDALEKVEAKLAASPTPDEQRAHDSSYPECSGEPASCPENEGFGCCKTATVATDAQWCSCVPTRCEGVGRCRWHAMGYVPKALQAAQSSEPPISLDWTEDEQWVRSQLQRMILSSRVLVGSDGTVTGYQIKTGALHKLIGRFAVNVPLGLPEVAASPSPDEQRAQAAQEGVPLWKLAYEAFDDYWQEDSKGSEQEAWQGVVDAIRAALAGRQQL